MKIDTHFLFSPCQAYCRDMRIARWVAAGKVCDRMALHNNLKSVRYCPCSGTVNDRAQFQNIRKSYHDSLGFIFSLILLPLTLYAFILSIAGVVVVVVVVVVHAIGVVRSPCAVHSLVESSLYDLYAVLTYLWVFFLCRPIYERVPSWQD